jgi:hypothetical protein
VNVGEIAASAAGDQNLFAGTVGALENRDVASPPARLNGAHESGGAGSKN